MDACGLTFAESVMRCTARGVWPFQSGHCHACGTAFFARFPGHTARFNNSHGVAMDCLRLLLTSGAELMRT